MRTTLDIPDDLFRRLKARAALEGLKLKDLLERYVAWGLRQSAVPPPEAEGAARPFVSAFDLLKDGFGIVDSGVTDLATNPKHMSGFGRE